MFDEVIGSIIEPVNLTLNASDLFASSTPLPIMNSELSSPWVLYWPETCWNEPEAIVPIPSACEPSPSAWVNPPSACEYYPIAWVLPPSACE